MGCGNSKVAVVISHIASSDPTSDVTGSTTTISACTQEQVQAVADLFVHNNMVYIAHHKTPNLFMYSTKGRFVQAVKMPCIDNPRCMVLLEGNGNIVKFVVGDFLRGLKWMSLGKKKHKYFVSLTMQVPAACAFVSLCVNSRKRHVIANDVENKRFHVYSYDGVPLNTVNVDKDVFPHRVTCASPGEGYIVTDPIRRYLVWLRSDGKVTRRVSLVVDDAADWEGYSTCSDVTVQEEEFTNVEIFSDEDKPRSSTVNKSVSTPSCSKDSSSDDDDDSDEKYFIPGDVITDCHGRLLLGSHSPEVSSVLLLSQHGEYMATLLKQCSHPVVGGQGQTLCVIRDWQQTQQLMILDYRELCTGVFPFLTSPQTA